MPSYPVTASGTLTITVGNGGTHPNSGSANGVIGQDSVVGSPGDPGLGSGGVLTAKGGGGGGRGVSQGGCAGQTGGSGGGGGTNISSQSSANQPTQPGNSGAYGFGNSGGTGAKGGGPYPNNNGGGGGGGAGAASANWFPAPAGTNAPSHAGSPGGIGRAYTIADGTTSVYYAGGGAGGGGGNNISFGGLGGGGGANPACNPGPGADCRPAIADVGSPYPSPVAEAMSGKANKGGGGAGTGDGAGPLQGCAGDGGKGVVIVRWTT
jgi:hypothetical protein